MRRPTNRDRMEDYFAEFIWNQIFKDLKIYQYLALNRHGFIFCLILLILEFCIKLKKFLLVLIFLVENNSFQMS